MVPFTQKVILLLLLLVLLLTPLAARADIAPPEQPPGANPAPDGEVTQVRMVNETVQLDVLDSPPEGSHGQARVFARFTMNNQGADAETMQVRFPLSFWDGQSDGFGNYPEIAGLQVRINGLVAPTERITTTNPVDEEHPIPWAAFAATFPPGQDVLIEVNYTAEATGEVSGEPPYIAFGYVLETGAGWNGTIGRAEILVRFPYNVSTQNVILGESVTGFSSTTPEIELGGREARWIFEDFEPTRAQNIEISLVKPDAWNTVLAERNNMTSNPLDGEAWGRLGKIYKEISRLRRGVRPDEGGRELFRLSVEAYEQAVTLLPEDALWHAGFSELLFDRYYWEQYIPSTADQSGVRRAVEEIHRAYQLDPADPFILELLEEMRFAMPEHIQLVGDTYVFTLLTATPPALPTATNTIPTELTPTPSPESTNTPTSAPPTATEPPPPTATATLTVPPPTATSPPEPTPAPGPGLPFCGGALLLPFVVMVLQRRKLNSLARKTLNVRRTKV